MKSPVTLGVGARLASRWQSQRCYRWQPCRRPAPRDAATGGPAGTPQAGASGTQAPRGKHGESSHHGAHSPVRRSSRPLGCRRRPVAGTRRLDSAFRMER